MPAAQHVAFGTAVLLALECTLIKPPALVDRLKADSQVEQALAAHRGGRVGGRDVVAAEPQAAARVRAKEAQRRAVYQQVRRAQVLRVKVLGDLPQLLVLQHKVHCKYFKSIVFEGSQQVRRAQVLSITVLDDLPQLLVLWAGVHIEISSESITRRLNLLNTFVLRRGSNTGWGCVDSRVNSSAGLSIAAPWRSCWSRVHTPACASPAGSSSALQLRSIERNFINKGNTDALLTHRIKRQRDTSRLRQTTGAMQRDSVRDHELAVQHAVQHVERRALHSLTLVCALCGRRKQHVLQTRYPSTSVMC